MILWLGFVSGLGILFSGEEVRARYSSETRAHVVSDSKTNILHAKGLEGTCQ